MVSVQLQYNYCQVTVAMVLLLSLSFYLYTLLGASVKKTDGTLSRTIVHLRCYVSFFLLFCRCSVLVFILLNEINKKSTKKVVLLLNLLILTLTYTCKVFNNKQQ